MFKYFWRLINNECARNIFSICARSSDVALKEPMIVKLLQLALDDSGFTQSMKFVLRNPY